MLQRANMQTAGRTERILSKPTLHVCEVTPMAAPLTPGQRAPHRLLTQRAGRHATATLGAHVPRRSQLRVAVRTTEMHRRHLLIHRSHAIVARQTNDLGGLRPQAVALQQLDVRVEPEARAAGGHVRVQAVAQRQQHQYAGLYVAAVGRLLERRSHHLDAHVAHQPVTACVRVAGAGTDTATSTTAATARARAGSGGSG